ncbi:hypothetical protein LZ31DRAFT_483978 [Colletotrichum somersetense]|nr:hypothetical protein LZ31DRAFT_483978 [Colletotrichum somersetense]
MNQFQVNCSTDEELINACNSITKKRCSNPKWLDLEEKEYTPSSDTAVIIVDMRNAEDCVFKVYTSKDRYVDSVGMNNKGCAVVIPWKSGRKFVCYGYCRVAEVTATQENST